MRHTIIMAATSSPSDMASDMTRIAPKPKVRMPANATMALVIDCRHDPS